MKHYDFYMRNAIDTQRYYLTSCKDSHNRSNSNKDRLSTSRTLAASKHQKETFYSRSILTWLILLILAIAATVQCLCNKLHFEDDMDC